MDCESVPSMGIFWDAFSALVTMAPKRLTGKERANQQYSSDKINTTTAENELVASNSTLPQDKGLATGWTVLRCHLRCYGTIQSGCISN